MAAWAAELAGRALDRVMVRRMKARPELEEKACHRVVAREEERRVQREARLYRDLIEMVRPQLVPRRHRVEGRRDADERPVVVCGEHGGVVRLCLCSVVANP